MRTRCLTVAGTLLMVMSSSLAGVAATVGPDFRVSGSGATGEEYTPAVAYGRTSNEYLVVWADTRAGEYRGSDIYGRRVGADGRPVGGDFRISGSQATAYESEPAVAHNRRDNEFMVVWRDGRNDGTRGYDVYGRRVGADGKPIGGDFRISGARATNNEANPEVAYNARTGRYLVVWQDRRNEADRDADIYGRWIGADGKPIGGDFRISGAKATAEESDPAVACSAKIGECLVAWVDKRQEGTRGWDIYGRRVGSDGKPNGGDLRISGSKAVSNEHMPSVAHNSSRSEYLVVWRDGRRPARGFDIYGRRIGADGKALGGDFRISGSDATANETEPTVAYNPKSDGYLVVWQDTRDMGARYDDIRGRRLEADGSPVSEDFPISGKDAVGSERAPAVAYGSRPNRYLVTWSDNRLEANRGFDIYGRRVAG